MYAHTLIVTHTHTHTHTGENLTNTHTHTQCMHTHIACTHTMHAHTLTQSHTHTHTHTRTHACTHTHTQTTYLPDEVNNSVLELTAGDEVLDDDEANLGLRVLQVTQGLWAKQVSTKPGYRASQYSHTCPFS